MDFKSIHLMPTWQQTEAARKKEVLKITGSALLGVGAGAAALAAAGPSIVAGASKLLPKVARALMPKTLKGAAIGITAAGVLSSSAKARTALKNAPKILYEKGKTIGNIIEDPKNTKDILGISGSKSVQENIISAGKKIGVAGLAAGAILGTGAVVAKKLKEKAEDISKTPSQSSLDKQPGAVMPSVVSNPFSNIPSTPSYGGTAATQSNLTPKPVTNIIQIQVR